MPESQVSPRLRLFVAITPPEEVKARIQQAQNELRRAVPDGVLRWSAPEQFHLTLRFLGSVDTEVLPLLTNSLENACASCEGMDLTAAGIGFFPRPRSPRVVWVGVSELHNLLVPLHAAVQLATDAFTTEPPETRFTGHITLGRIKSIRPPEADVLADAASRFSGKVFGEWRGMDVELVRSDLSPKGARYTTVQSFPLRPAA